VRSACGRDCPVIRRVLFFQPRLKNKTPSPLPEKGSPSSAERAGAEAASARDVTGQRSGLAKAPCSRPDPGERDKKGTVARSGKVEE
jgi:hypothetical protein